MRLRRSSVARLCVTTTLLAVCAVLVLGQTTPTAGAVVVGPLGQRHRHQQQEFIGPAAGDDEDDDNDLNDAPDEADAAGEYVQRIETLIDQYRSLIAKSIVRLNGACIVYDRLVAASLEDWFGGTMELGMFACALSVTARP